MAEIALTQGKVALVSDVDAEWLGQWVWCYRGQSGVAMRNRRVGESATSSHILMHRAILGHAGYDLTGLDVAHLNGDLLDNRRENLRAAPTRLQNRHGDRKGRRGRNPTNPDLPESKVTKLTDERAALMAPYVRGRSLRLAKACGFLFDRDEIEQMMWLGILERGERDAAFLEESDQWVVIGGEYYAATQIWKRKYRDRMSCARQGELSDQDWAKLEGSADHGPMHSKQSTIEDGNTSLLGWMEEMFDCLPAIYRFVAEGLLVGLQRQEIAQRMPAAGFEPRTPAWVGQFATRKLGPQVLAWIAA
jgi:hypothetical protein